VGQSHKGSSPTPIVPKLNRKFEKKDASNGIDLKMNLLSNATSKPVKGNGLSTLRNSTGGIKPTLINSAATMIGSTQIINGVTVQVPQNVPMKPTMGNSSIKSHLPNGTLSKSHQTINVQKNLPLLKSKPKPENLVLTHVIDGYVIQESPNPFPINGYSNSSDADQSEKNSEVSAKSDSKENLQANKPQELVNGGGQIHGSNMNGIARNTPNNEVTMKPKLSNGFGDFESNKSKKSKTKKSSKVNSATQVVNQMPQKSQGVQSMMPNQAPAIPSQGVASNQPVTNANGKRMAQSAQTKEITNEKRARVNSPVQVNNERPFKGSNIKVNIAFYRSNPNPITNSPMVRQL